MTKGLLITALTLGISFTHTLAQGPHDQTPGTVVRPTADRPSALRSILPEGQVEESLAEAVQSLEKLDALNRGLSSTGERVPLADAGFVEGVIGDVVQREYPSQLDEAVGTLDSFNRVNSEVAKPLGEQ